MKSARREAIYKELSGKKCHEISFSGGYDVQLFDSGELVLEILVVILLERRVLVRKCRLCYSVITKVRRETLEFVICKDRRSRVLVIWK